jgi:CheY-like chemotaxis protein
MHGRPILYVEDDKDDVFFMQRAFREADLASELVALPSGQQAIDYLVGDGKFARREKHPLPCLMLLDLNMPGRSGFDVLKWIRARPAISALPVVVFTSSRDETDIQRAYQHGANAYLLKPALPEKLADVLKTINDFWLGLNQLPPDSEKFA